MCLKHVLSGQGKPGVWELIDLIGPRTARVPDSVALAAGAASTWWCAATMGLARGSWTAVTSPITPSKRSAPGP
eukprot:11221019-Lingulodinium_polyedra.AAC.1